GFSIDRLSCAGKDGAGVIVSVKGRTIGLKRSSAVFCAMRDITDMIRMEEENRTMQARLAQAGKTACGGARGIKDAADGRMDFSSSDGVDMEGEFDVNSAVTSAVSALSGRIKGHTDNFHVECAGGLPCVRGSALKMERVVAHLVASALRTLNDRSRGLWVSTAYDKGRGTVEIAVKDDGRGMSKEALERVNEPSLAADAQAGGARPGLLTSHSIVREHGGTLEFVSEPGMGAVARIRLPAVVKNGWKADFECFLRV
ncbi:MAG: HAMP domain-containing sensor histidine kinase, partial [Deltaproteobacteria bacterium]